MCDIQHGPLEELNVDKAQSEKSSDSVSEFQLIAVTDVTVCWTDPLHSLLSHQNSRNTNSDMELKESDSWYYVYVCINFSIHGIDTKLLFCLTLKRLLWAFSVLYQLILFSWIWIQHCSSIWWKHPQLIVCYKLMYLDTDHRRSYKLSKFSTKKATSSHLLLSLAKPDNRAVTTVL